MNWFKEYKLSLKSIEAEEPLDIYLYRPLAFIIVKTFYALPLTPNHYSLMALISGLISAYLFAQGNELALQWGGFAFLMFAIFDCCDGMVARLKKNGSEFGRIIDGLVDYTVNAAAYVGLAIGIGKMFPEFFGIPSWILVVLAGLSKAIHAFVFDHYLAEYISHSKGKTGFTQNEIVSITEKIADAKKRGYTFWQILALKIYLMFTSVQAKSDEGTLNYDPAKYCQSNLKLIRLWSLIGPAPHITILIIAFLIKSPGLLFGYAIVFGNIWLALMFLYQKQVNSVLCETQRSAV